MKEEVASVSLRIPGSGLRKHLLRPTVPPPGGLLPSVLSGEAGHCHPPSVFHC